MDEPDTTAIRAEFAEGGPYTYYLVPELLDALDAARAELGDYRAMNDAAHRRMEVAEARIAAALEIVRAVGPGWPATPLAERVESALTGDAE